MAFFISVNIRKYIFAFELFMRFDLNEERFLRKEDREPLGYCYCNMWIIYG